MLMKVFSKNIILRKVCVLANKRAYKEVLSQIVGNILLQNISQHFVLFQNGIFYSDIALKRPNQCFSSLF